MKLILLFFLLVSSLTSFASDIPFTGWKAYLEHEKGLLADLFPDSRFLDNRWVKYEEFDVDGRQLPPNTINVIPLQCRSRKLYPTHPQQFSKEYIYGVVSKYDNVRLPGTSSSCELATRNARAYCIRAMRAVVAVMSDTYEDGCGNFYRAYWLKNYRVAMDRRKSEDNMGTLFSKGRTVYPKANAQFSGEVDTGDSYPVDVNEFLFLAPLLASDRAKIREFQNYAIRAGYKREGKIWRAK